jgi:hypothetical protein
MKSPPLSTFFKFWGNWFSTCSLTFSGILKIPNSFLELRVAVKTRISKADEKNLTPQINLKSIKTRLTSKSQSKRTENLSQTHTVSEYPCGARRGKACLTKRFLDPSSEFGVFLGKFWVVGVKFVVEFEEKNMFVIRLDRLVLDLFLACQRAFHDFSNWSQKYENWRQDLCWHSRVDSETFFIFVIQPSNG